jgi:hypothetical protein
VSLQLLDRARQWWLGDVQPFCRPVEVTFVRNRHEVTQEAHVHHEI